MLKSKKRFFCSVSYGLLEENVLSHTPVLLNEVLDVFNSNNNKIILDLTFGNGGHSKSMLMDKNVIKHIGIDRDFLAYKSALELSKLHSQFRATQGKFSELDKICKENDIIENTVDFILMDLGFSSIQMDNSKRGFSLSKNGKLDMRMNQNSDELTASDVINNLDENQLRDIFSKYGEERCSSKIARMIVEYRTTVGPILTTYQLAELTAKCVGWGKKYDALKRKVHPATQIFQALRIFVNDELNELWSALNFAKRYLTPLTGRCVVISFHSLEDRLVKLAFQGKDFDGFDNSLKKLALIDQNGNTEELYSWKKVGDVISPTPEEIKVNPRCRSAKMRTGKIVVENSK